MVRKLIAKLAWLIGPPADNEPTVSDSLSSDAAIAAWASGPISLFLGYPIFIPVAGEQIGEVPRGNEASQTDRSTPLT